MITVLYEDKLGTSSRYSVHRFVCRCVLDQLGRIDESEYSFERSHCSGIPLKGDGNLKRECSKEYFEKFRDPFCSHAFAVFDRDKLHKLLNLSGTPCRAQLLDCLRTECPSGKLQFILLADNLESVIERIAASGLTSINESTFASAIAKNLLARDSIFNQCANLDVSIRHQLIEKLSDLNRLVTRVADIVRAEPSPST